jgi:hypothetical protein
MRIRLPDTRHSVTRKVALNNWELYVTVGFYDNRQPGEVFVKVAKHGTTISGLMDGIAVLASMLLQNGVAWDVIHAKLKDTSFEPRGMDANQREYRSLLDCLTVNVREVVKDGDGDPTLGHTLPTAPNHPGTTPTGAVEPSGTPRAGATP